MKYQAKTCEEANQIEVEEILEEGIPFPRRHYTHYYVSIEDECSYASHDCFTAKPIPSQSYNQFLRLPKIHIPISKRVKSEPIIDYNRSQILTFTSHVDKLHQISEKKAHIEEERAKKQKQRELIIAKWAEKRIVAAAMKRRKIAKQEARKISRESWTTTIIRAAGERLQNFIKNTSSHENSTPRLGLEALSIAKEIRIRAKARLEAKKNKRKHGIPLPIEPFPPLLEHPSFYSLLREVPLLVSRMLIAVSSSLSFGVPEENLDHGICRAGSSGALERCYMAGQVRSTWADIVGLHMAATTHASFQMGDG